MGGKLRARVPPLAAPILKTFQLSLTRQSFPQHGKYRVLAGRPSIGYPPGFKENAGRRGSPPIARQAAAPRVLTSGQDPWEVTDRASRRQQWHYWKEQALLPRGEERHIPVLNTSSFSLLPSLEQQKDTHDAHNPSLTSFPCAPPAPLSLVTSRTKHTGHSLWAQPRSRLQL